MKPRWRGAGGHVKPRSGRRRACETQVAGRRRACEAQVAGRRRACETQVAGAGGLVKPRWRAQEGM